MNALTIPGIPMQMPHSSVAPSPLCRDGLTVAEQHRLLGLLENLARFLGSAGDWGPDTRLGRYTTQTLAVMAAVRATEVRP